MGTEVGRLAGYSFQGTVTASDRSNQKGEKIRAGYVILRKKGKRQQGKVGHEEEGSSSNRVELAAFIFALRGTPVTTSMLYLCDNQALLKALKRWVGKGRKAMLIAPDADILLDAIEDLQKRPTAGAEMFLVKVKAHRGEPANESADIQVDKTISNKDVPTEWHDSTNKAVLTWQEPRRKVGTVSYEEDRKSTWNSRCGRQLDEDQQKRRCANTGIM